MGLEKDYANMDSPGIHYHRKQGALPPMKKEVLGG
jgi:hypothetical protein